MASQQMTGLAEIRFGTDGWRAVIAREFTFANVERVTQAYSDWLNSQTADTKLVVIGYDRRFQFDNFARRTAEVLAGNCFRVALFNVSVQSTIDSCDVMVQHSIGVSVINASQ